MPGPRIAPTLTPREELLLKWPRRIVVKFIEVGRNLAGFPFCRHLHQVIDTLRQS